MLSDVWEDLAFEITIGELISQGFLCKVSNAKRRGKKQNSNNN